uniref:Uncharacterized protein n=1 Tax=Ganoderma boninense TaxID=34458 RepID=A0A5K1K728_9APHY|nr:Uncharacterized protein [Ganoderma boninense]
MRVLTDHSLVKESRDDPEVVQTKGRCAGFYKGGNSSLRSHIASFHYKEYSRKCKKAGIEENHHAIPDDIKEAREAVEKGSVGQKGGQRTLDGVVKKVQRPTAFCPMELLQRVMQHVVCCDEPLAVADAVTFRNVLITMRPKTVKSELLTYSTVRSHITNTFVDYMTRLKEDISRAPGAVNTMGDTWTAPHTSDPMFGLLVVWIDIQPDGTWVYRDEVAAFHKILGDHGGANLGRYLLLFLDRCGVTSRAHSKLGHMTNDNASNNLSSVKEVQRRLIKRGVVTRGEFNANERNLSCFRHVIQLGIEDFMEEIMSKAAVATKQAIWDYDPEDEGNLINGALDVIAIIRTLTVKRRADHLAYSRCICIQASGQCKQVFWCFQLEHPQLGNARNIPLHNNTCWGCAHGMLDVSFELQDPITLFVEHADAKFGPITTLRPKGGPTRDIPWSAFKLKKPDWIRVRLCAEIIEDANDYQQICSSTRSPTLHQVIPVLENLATRWEVKAKNTKFEPFHDALEKGLAKINKYYKKLDNTDVYILALLLHPYYKPDYIESEWGSQAEYDADVAAGELNPINWTAHAQSITEKAHYWPLRFGCPSAPAANDEPNAVSGSNNTRVDDYDRAGAAHLRNAHAEDGWKTELRHYLDD